MIKDKFRIKLNMKQKMCNSCKKTNTEYYELKLQLRFEYYDDIEKIKSEIINLIAKNFNTINKLEELKNGFDIYFRNKFESNKILNLFNNKYLFEEKRSKKIVGRDSLTTKDIWRYILLINFINLNKGDKILIKGDKYLIKHINYKNNNLVLIKIDDSSKKVISYSIIKDYLQK